MQNVTGGNGLLHSVDGLIGMGGEQTDFSTAGLQHEVALRVHFDCVCALDAQRDVAGISVRPDDEVVFELALVPPAFTARTR